MSANTIKAIVVDPDKDEKLVIGEVEAPQAAASEAIIRVAAISLNRGEVRGAMSSKAGSRPGWDLAGVVEQAAADGSGPKAGTRVVGMARTGAWAEMVAIPTNFLAALPDAVSFANAATLPVAGLTALHSVAKGGDLLERKVLVTGATGGVGYFAVQLAKLAGAQVVGLVRKPEQEALIKGAGADQVAISADATTNVAELGPYNLVVDAVGGAVLGRVMTMLAPGGVCVAFGPTTGAEVNFQLGGFFSKGGVTLYGLSVFYELTRESATIGLGRLARLMEAGKLQAHISMETDWKEIGAVAKGYLEREYPGKVVLHLS